MNVADEMTTQSEAIQRGLNARTIFRGSALAGFLRSIFFSLFLLCSIFVPTTLLRAQTAGPTQKIEIVHADTLLGQRMSGEEEIIDFQGHVQFRQGIVSITSDRAIYYSSGDRAILTGNVRIIQPGTTLTAPQVDYNGATGIATAPEGLSIKEEKGSLDAGYGEYYINTRISYFRNDVTLRDSNIVLKATGGSYYSTERKAIFDGNVSAVSDSGTLTSEHLTYWRDSEESYAVGAVTLVSKSDSSILTCDTLQHRPKVETWAFGNVTLVSKSDSSILTCNTLHHRPDVETFAVGNVRLTSDKESATLSGDSLRHHPQEKYTVVTGSPRLMQIDSTLKLIVPSDSAETPKDSAAPSPPDSLAVQLDTIRRGDSLYTLRRDTTTITATKLERFTAARKEFTATGNARIRRGTLEAAAEVARYFEDDEIVALGPGMKGRTGTDSGAVASDSNGVVDGADTTVPDKDGSEDQPAVTGDSISAHAAPIVWYEESQLTGDTITVFLEKKKLHTIDVIGNAFAISKSDAPGRYDQLASERLIFNVAQDTVRSIRANGTAASIYFLYDNNAPNGLNRSSGDTIVIYFADGKASRVGIYGPRTRLEGEVIPEKDVSGREIVYRLSGFNLYEREAQEGEEPTKPEDPNGTGPQEEKQNGKS